MNAPALLTGFGLRLRSELPVPGAQAADELAGGPDLTITFGDASLPEADLPHAGRELPPYRVTGTSLLFTLPEVARYRCDAGHTVTVQAQPGADPEEVAARLIATALPAALWMRGHLVLHASGAVLPGQSRAIAFAGPSGWGKSTVLQRLLDGGASVVGDDTLCLREDDGPLLASGLPGLIHQQDCALGADVSGRRRMLPVPAVRQCREAELDAILVAGPEPEPTRLHGSDALAAILRNLHRPRIPTLLGLHAALLPRLAHLVQRVPVYSCNVRGHLPDAAALAALLAAGAAA